MRISPISYYSNMTFGNKHTKKERAKAAQMQKMSKPAEIQNDVFESKMKEIKQSDKKFKPNQQVAQRLEEMKGRKLAKFDNDVIKQVLSTDEKDTERAITDINTVERFSAEEIKLLMRDPAARMHINYLMSGSVPKCSAENSEIILRRALFRIMTETEGV